MEYRNLGRTGVKVSPLCLGTMMFGPGGNEDEADSIRIIHAALDAGINFVDTADVYSAGVSEEITGKALKGRRDDVVLATKFFMPMDADDPNQRGGSRRWIIREVENSFRRLGTDYIDLYQVHRPDAAIDIEETLGLSPIWCTRARSATSGRHRSRDRRSSRRSGHHVRAGWSGSSPDRRDRRARRDRQPRRQQLRNARTHAREPAPLNIAVGVTLGRLGARTFASTW